MELKVKEFVLGLFEKGLENDKVEHKIYKFFKNYDESKEPQIQKLQKRIEAIKKSNTK